MNIDYLKCVSKMWTTSLRLALFCMSALKAPTHSLNARQTAQEMWAHIFMSYGRCKREILLQPEHDTGVDITDPAISEYVATINTMLNIKTDEAYDQFIGKYIHALIFTLNRIKTLPDAHTFINSHSNTKDCTTWDNDEGDEPFPGEMDDDDIPWEAFQKVVKFERKKK